MPGVLAPLTGSSPSSYDGTRPSFNIGVGARNMQHGSVPFWDSGGNGPGGAINPLVYLFNPTSSLPLPAFDLSGNPTNTTPPSGAVGVAQYVPTLDPKGHRQRTPIRHTRKQQRSPGLHWEGIAAWAVRTIHLARRVVATSSA